MAKAKETGLKQQKFQDWYNQKAGSLKPVQDQCKTQKGRVNKGQMKPVNRTRKLIGKRSHPPEKDHKAGSPANEVKEENKKDFTEKDAPVSKRR